MEEKKIEVNVSAKDGELVIRHGDAPEIFTYRGQRFLANSMNAFIDLAKKHMVVAGSPVAAYDEQRIIAVLNQSVHDRPLDMICYNYKFALDYRYLKGLLGKAMTQKDLIDAVKRLTSYFGWKTPADLLIARLKTLKLVTNIAGDFQVDDNNNYTFAIKVGDAEGTTQLPSELVLDMPIYNEQKEMFEVNLELEVVKPKNENERPLFVLRCPLVDILERDALLSEIKNAQEQLVEMLIVEGDLFHTWRDAR